MADATLFEDGCPEEQHTWGQETVAETSVGTLTGRTCEVCGLVWVGLKRSEATR